MFQLVKEELGSGQLVIPDSLGQELPSHIHEQPLTKVLLNHEMDNGHINLQFSRE